MPTYDYKCDKCGHTWELFQSITADPVKTCPECKKRKVRRLISQTSFVLKGSGWYVTDYARKGASASTAGNGGTSASPSTKTETKKAETKKDGAKKDASSATAHH